MQLIPSVASYLGLQGQLKEALTADHLQLLATVAESPLPRRLASETLLGELLEMHTVRLEDGLVKLATAVFLERDIQRVIEVASSLGQRLADRLLVDGQELLTASPEIRNFLGGVIAAAQGPSRLLQTSGNAVNWRDYTGRYASTKVDFDQECPAFSALGPELQVKSVQKGDQYTAVFIGPGGTTFVSLLRGFCPPEHREYRQHLLRFLTDAYGRLLAGELTSSRLAQTAEQVGLFQNGQPRPVLVTPAIYAQYRDVIVRIAAASSQLYLEQIGEVFACLRETTSGRQGVPSENMIMHFGRYCRKALAKELYAAGFFTDRVPEQGSITVFYANRISELNAYLGG